MSEYATYIEQSAFEDGLAKGRAELRHRIEELQAQLDAVRERVLNCQQYTTNSAMVHEGRFMEVVAVKAAIKGDDDDDE